MTLEIPDVVIDRLPLYYRVLRSLYDWLGPPVAVGPEWGEGYRVVPDDEVGWRRESRERVQARVKAGPHSPLHVLEHLPPSSAWLLPDQALTEHDRLLCAMAERVRLELVRLAGALGAVDMVLQEMLESFNGVDLLPPVLRDSPGERQSRARPYV